MSSQEDKIHQVMSSGAQALSLTYEAIRQFDSPRVFMRTSMNINSLELGILTPQQYRYVAQRTSQADHLFERHLHKLLEKIPEFMANPNPIQFFTVPAYGRMLKNGTLSTILFDRLTAHPQVSSSMLCIELSADLLFEELEPLQAELQKLRELGVRIALTEVGDEFCPLLRLSQLPYDLAFLDTYPVSLVNTPGDSAFEGLAGFLHSCGKKMIAVDVKDRDLLFQLEQLGCDGYSLMDSASLFPDYSQEDSAQ